MGGIIAHLIVVVFIYPQTVHQFAIYVCIADACRERFFLRSHPVAPNQMVARLRVDVAQSTSRTTYKGLFRDRAGPRRSGDSWYRSFSSQSPVVVVVT
jgi:hypothetical protein